MPTASPAANRTYCRKHYGQLRTDPAKWDARLAKQRLRRRRESLVLGGTQKPLERLTPDQKELFEERAAIMEFDGGLSREDAEIEALLALLLDSGQQDQETSTPDSLGDSSANQSA